jgi:hypothetical protein
MVDRPSFRLRLQLRPTSRGNDVECSDIEVITHVLPVN